MTLNIINIKQEQLNFLRNSDIFTVGQRGVTTQEDTGTWASSSTHTLATNPTTCKNIRSVTRGSLLAYGEDYTVNFLTGVITFTVEQTGSYTVSYDTGSDKIYGDFPRDDLTINSYPRIAMDILNAPIEPFGIGGDSWIADVSFTVVVYDTKNRLLDSYIQTIKDLYQTNAKNFYYLGFTMPTLIGPTIDSPDKKNEIMSKNIDIIGRFNVD